MSQQFFVHSTETLTGCTVVLGWRDKECVLLKVKVKIRKPKVRVKGPERKWTNDYRILKNKNRNTL